MRRRTPVLALSLLLLAGCSSESAPEPGPTGHGAVAGAAEVAEPQLHLVAIDEDGRASMLDLLAGTETDLGSLTPAEKVSSDGRYVFAADGSGVSVVDSGVWTWDHVDHFHYYRSQPRTLGRVTGEGVAAVSTGMLSTAGTTGVFFPDSGEAVLLDNQALSRGTITEKLRLRGEPHQGLVAPLGEGALVSRNTSTVDAVDARGGKLASVGCPDPSGTVTTRVGLVVGCADGAVLATLDGEKPVLTAIPYPEGAAAPATSFDGRKGRPTVAGLGDGSGIWLLDTREETWQWLPTTTRVVAAAAVDDAGGHVVAVGEDDTVQVYDAGSGRRLASTGPLDLGENVQLTVDAQRAYVNGTDGVYEIDYADEARVARELEMPTKPVHLAETGR
ncbi:hypothetical protein [Kineosporia succinea]|uniref:ABC transporter n=1 Tax=Kineosporia succinea TaxID=84632 RepID=A0ABT9PCH5_9ACTN|nr:hypothetical protein [Kineosporia succinea]MDP9830099.1 hypothetical protein [Kineosporia succinea]